MHEWPDFDITNPDLHRHWKDPCTFKHFPFAHIPFFSHSLWSNKNKEKNVGLFDQIKSICYLPMQRVPSEAKSYPGGHEHIKLPGVLLHCPLLQMPCWEHSSISKISIANKKPLIKDSI